MSARRRLLVLGVGPMPHEAGRQLMAPGLRLDTFARALAGAGHQVVVGRARFAEVAGGEGIPEEPATQGAAAADPGFEVRDLAPRDVATLRRWQAESPFDAVAALTDVLAHAAIEARLPVPILVDYNGDPITERQMQGVRAGNDVALIDAAWHMLPVLLGADQFTACSAPQRMALLGELGLVGRLNRHTSSGDLVHVVRSAHGLLPLQADDEGPAASVGTFRGTEFPAEAVAILWSGGFNNWTDLDTLLGALEHAMSASPLVHFVSSGGAIPGHGVGVYESFARRVEQSRWRDRFHLLGWLPKEQIPALYADSDLAITLDAPCVEGEMGSRTRLFDWAAAGLAIVTTTPSEVAQYFVAEGGAVGVPTGDVRALAAAIEELSSDVDRRRALGAAAKGALARWRATAFPAAVLAWAENPRGAPDLPPPIERSPATLVRPDNPLAELCAAVLESRGLRDWREDRGSRLYAMYRRLRALVGRR